MGRQEEVEKILDDFFDGACGATESTYKATRAYDAARIDALYSGWVSVEDRLPSGGVYLTSNGDDILIQGYWPHLDPVWGTLDVGSGFIPTHWMPLPAPPEEGENA